MSEYKYFERRPNLFDKEEKFLRSSWRNSSFVDYHWSAVSKLILFESNIYVGKRMNFIWNRLLLLMIWCVCNQKNYEQQPASILTHHLPYNSLSSSISFYRCIIILNKTLIFWLTLERLYIMHFLQSRILCPLLKKFYSLPVYVKTWYVTIPYPFVLTKFDKLRAIIIFYLLSCKWLHCGC